MCFPTSFSKMKKLVQVGHDGEILKIPPKTEKTRFRRNSKVLAHVLGHPEPVAGVFSKVKKVSFSARGTEQVQVRQRVHRWGVANKPGSRRELRHHQVHVHHTPGDRTRGDLVTGPYVFNDVLSAYVFLLPSPNPHVFVTSPHVFVPRKNVRYVFVTAPHVFVTPPHVFVRKSYVFVTFSKKLRF